MAFAPPAKSKATTNLAKSTWTPMNHPEANLQVFEERREIIKKWFQKWQDGQKRIIVDDILRNLSTKHLISLNSTLNSKFPQEKHDFTRILPRVLTLYLFSFLDPRTLCRCAQVSWYWNYLSEMDCLWRPKCLKFGWYPTYKPSPFEEKIWKRFYVSTVHELHYAKAKAVKSEAEQDVEDEKRPDTARSAMSKVSVARSTASSMTGIKRGPTTPSPKKPLSGPKWQPPPWKGSDPHPIDTQRYNYLNNKSKSSKKKSSGTPHSRPSSKQSGRPLSAAGSSRQNRIKDEYATGAHITNGDETGTNNYGYDLDRTSRLSGKVLASYPTTGSVPSPRLNRDFQLPQYNGHGHGAPAQLGMSSDFNQTSQYGATINSQVNWPKNQTTRSSYSFDYAGTTSINQQHTERPKSSYTRRGSNRASTSNPADAATDLSRLSIDAGVRPKPVLTHTPEKNKKAVKLETSKEPPEILPGSSSKAITTSDANVELKGKKWDAPAESNSDEDF